jgi:MFS family permease
MATTTAVEVHILNQDGTSRLSNDYVPEGPAQISLSTAGPATSIRDSQPVSQILSQGRSAIVVTQLAGINFVTSFSNGLITVGLPAIATALDLKSNLLVWPSAAFALTSGSLLLLAGSFADVIGPRSVNLTGCFFVALFTLLSGVARSGIELVLFRALQGVASALTFPSSISIISKSVEAGKRRNVGFACLGLAMPLGFSFGLVLGGVFVTGLGWQVGFYIGGGAGFLLFFVGIWSLPPGIKPESATQVWKRLAWEVDWVGVVVASTCLALFSYVLATLSASIENIKKATSITLLVLSLLLAAAFMAWMHRQEKASKPALIPNSIWKKRAFTTICLMVLLSTAVMNCMELFSSLFFQEVQGLSALQASLRILPNMLLGIATNFATGYFINKVPAIYAVLISSSLCAGAPLLMALIDPNWTYWYERVLVQHELRNSLITTNEI